MNLGFSDAKVIGSDEEPTSEEGGDQSLTEGDWERSGLDQADDHQGQPRWVAGTFGNRLFSNLEARVVPSSQSSRPRGEPVEAASPQRCVVSCPQDPGVLLGDQCGWERGRQLCGGRGCAT